MSDANTTSAPDTNTNTDANLPQATSNNGTTSVATGDSSLISSSTTTAPLTSPKTPFTTPIETPVTTPSETLLTTLSETLSPSLPAETTHIVHPCAGRVTAGAAAGAIVGTSVAICLATVLLMILFYRRRTGKYPFFTKSNEKTGNGPSTSGTGVSNMDRRVTIPASSFTYSWEEYFASEVDDPTILSKVNLLFSNINFHVDNFYRNVHVTGMGQLGGHHLDIFTTLQNRPIRSLLQEGRRSGPLIKYCLTKHITSWTSMSGDTRNSLLPPPYGFNPVNDDRRDLGEAFCYWRMLTSVIQPPASTQDASHQEKVRRFAEELCESLEPWANSFSKERRTENLIHILKEAIDAGILLLRQRCQFEWRWNENGYSALNANNIAVQPALYKVTDENGHILEIADRMKDLTVDSIM